MPCPTVRDYFALALSIASRRHRPVLQEFRDDVLQACRPLAEKARLSVMKKNDVGHYTYGKETDGPRRTLAHDPGSDQGHS